MNWSFFSSIKREQREAIGLLQIGTFLEYFDLMLYVHMAVLLNDLFFPRSDPKTAVLLSAFAFCSTYILRPIGALFFGYLGDHIGRKSTVIITTMMMATSCIIMANLPTYSQIGIAAAWGITLCRGIQGISSLGEIIGAEIYLTEIIKLPMRYPVVALIAVFATLGSMFALVVASLSITFGLSWRTGFWIGAAIAIVGTLARTRLRETSEFVDMKRRMKKAVEEDDENGLVRAAQRLKKTNVLWKEKADKKTLVYYFLIQCGWPAFFYFTYIHCGNILKDTLGYTAEQVINHNLIVSMVQLAIYLFLALLSYRVHPLKILRVKAFVFIPFVILLPNFLSESFVSPLGLFLIQSFCSAFGPTMNPAPAVFLAHLPIYRRFTYTSLIFAVSHALIYAIAPFGIVYLTTLFGNWGICILFLPITIGFALSVGHFERLERERKPFTSLFSKWAFQKNLSTLK